MATQQQIAERMVDQLRVLDPSISAEVGTPERQIIDTVAQSLAEAQVDLNTINGALDIDAKIGSDLDNILSLFGFGRQSGVKATGYVQFSRSDAAPADIRVPAGTQVIASGMSDHDAVFMTTSTVFIAQGQTSVIAPVECIVVGESGNVPADTIKSFYQTTVSGVTKITNAYAITGGVAKETDNSVKARFKSSGPFRNLAGTESQYLALAISTLAQKANVIGPISKWREYVQVPSNDDTSANKTSGVGQYTTALSTNRSAKYIYDHLPNFVSVEANQANKFYREDLDYQFNIDNVDKNRGDAWRLWKYTAITSTTNVINVTTTAASTTATLDSTSGLTSGLRYTISSTTIPEENDVTFVYTDTTSIILSSSTGITAGTSAATIFLSIDDDPTSNAATYRPNLTFLNVWTGSGTKPTAAIAPKDILLLEYNYTSSASRNDYERGILNCVDVYIDNADSNVATEVIPRPGVNVPTIQFSSDSTNPFYIENFRRVSEPERRPVVGNILTSLLEQPVLDLPNQINFSDTTFYKNVHYWLVTDITNIGGTVRARNGIEWAYNIRGATKLETAAGPFTGQFIRKALVFDEIKYSYGKATTLSSASDKKTITLSTSNISNFNYGSGIPEVGMTVDDPSNSFIVAGTKIASISGTTTLTITLDTAMNITANQSDIQLTFGYPLTTTSTQINLTSTSDWPSSGVVTIDNEDIAYSKNDATNAILTISSRGYNSTTAAAHSIGATAALKSSTADNSVTVTDYLYDRNIIVLQSALEASKQITTDILAHKAKVRYFKPDLTIIPENGFTIFNLQQNIKIALNNYFNSTQFGGVIQLSDILQYVHNIVGVDAVKWSKDSLTKTTDAFGDPRNRLTETSIYGDSITGIILEKVQIGGSGSPWPATQYQFYFTGNPSGGKFSLNYGSQSSGSFTIQQLINAATPTAAATIIENGLGASLVDVSAGSKNVPDSSNRFTITLANASSKDFISSFDVYLIGGNGAINTDVILKDSELASLPTGKTLTDGSIDLTSIMTIRVKTESTWNVIE